MLRSAFLPDFKSTDTLLIWGNIDDAVRLHAGLLATGEDRHSTFCVEGGPELTRVLLRMSSDDGLSRIAGTEEEIVWSCSRDVLRYVRALIEPLMTTSGGHQYIAVQGGLASQIMTSVNEYPESLRR